MQRSLPEILELLVALFRRPLALPVIAHNIVRRNSRLPRQHSQHLVHRFAVIERRNQRLHDPDSSVIPPRIAPRFQEMRLRNVPVAKLRRLIAIKPKMNPQRNFPELLREIHVRRRCIHGIAAQNHQRLHRTRVNFLRQFRHAVRVRRNLDRIRINDRLARIPQRLIHRVRQRMNCRRLRISRHNQARPAMLLQIPHQRRHPFFRHALRRRMSARNANAQRRAQRPRKSINLPATHRQPMIRHRPRIRRRALHHVQPVHPRLRPRNPPPIRKLPRVTHRSRPVVKKIRIERQNDVRLLQPVNAIHIPPKRQLRSFARVVRPARLVHVPLRLRIKRQQRRHLRPKRRRSARIAQNPQPRALRALPIRAHVRDSRQESRPIADAPFTHHHLRTIRVVKRQNRSLGENIRRPQTSRMLQIPFHLRRPPHVALNEQPHRPARIRHRSRIKKRLARNDLLGRFHVRHNLLRRQFRASAQTRKRRRSRHQFQNVPPRKSRTPRLFSRLLLRIMRKLVMHKHLILRRPSQFLETLPKSLPMTRSQFRPNSRKIHRLLRYRCHRSKLLLMILVRCRPSTIRRAIARPLLT